MQPGTPRGLLRLVPALGRQDRAGCGLGDLLGEAPSQEAPHDGIEPGGAEGLPDTWGRNRAASSDACATSSISALATASSAAALSIPSATSSATRAVRASALRDRPLLDPLAGEAVVIDQAKLDQALHRPFDDDPVESGRAESDPELVLGPRAGRQEMTGPLHRLPVRPVDERVVHGICCSGRSHRRLLLAKPVPPPLPVPRR